MPDSNHYEESHLKVLRVLVERPDISQRELAKALGISLGKANYCLKALLNKGLVKAQNFAASSNKFAYAYVVTPAGLTAKMAMTHRFLRRKMVEYDALKREIATLEAEVRAKRRRRAQ